MKRLQSTVFIPVLLCLLTGTFLFAQQPPAEPMLQWDQIEKEIETARSDGDIPGLSVVIVKGKNQWIKNYGFADVEQQQPVSDQTLFEIGSCSKAFTALAAARLIKEGKLDPEADIRQYIPWLTLTYEEQPAVVKVIHLLHHTSGIPWNTISLIPESEAANALELTVRQLEGQELDEEPGEEYEYATINYDVLALLIQKVSGQPFETYLQEQVIQPLELHHTSIGVASDPAQMSTGHKIGFFSARPYEAPVYKGNNAAGYVISNAEDMARWLKFQMGLLESKLNVVAQFTHQRDESVALHFMSSYAKGWEVVLDGSHEIRHGGLNPNFTSFVAFRPKEQLGIVVLANSNSTHTPILAHNLMTLLAGDEIENRIDPGDNNDKTYSTLSIALMLYILIVLGFLGINIKDVVTGKRSFEAWSLKKAWTFLRSLLFVGPFLLGLYLFPEAIAGFSWKSILVWTPASFSVMVQLVLGAVAISYLAYFVSLSFPAENEYRRMAPQIVLLSILSGLSNVVLVIMVTSAIDSDIELHYLIFYYSLVLSLYLLGRKFVQISLIKFTRGLIYDMKVQLIDKIFSTSYQKFEKIDRGRVYTALNDDVNVIGQSTNTFVSLITSIITTFGAFVFLASIAFWATVLTIILIVSLTATYYYVSSRTNVYFEEARDEQNVYMRLLNGMIDGFKEISMHRNKKLQYKADIAESADQYRKKISTADIRFVNAYLVGESLLVVLLGIVAFGITELFPNIETYVVMSFVIILLYLIGPINGILNAVPTLMYLRVAWNRVQNFLKDIPANLDLSKVPPAKAPVIQSLQAEGICFQYDKKEDEAAFGIGPIDLEVKQGEILFIIGGNGSGKTTLAKMLTGLYQPDKGALKINGETVSNHELSEYFSTVFSPAHLFEKLYDIDYEAKKEAADEYLKKLQL
ncbi:MAG: serine hydrolase, partial [Bacteroidota bacterium]